MPHGVSKQWSAWSEYPFRMEESGELAEAAST
jgi:hypothetical protein